MKPTLLAPRQRVLTAAVLIFFGTLIVSHQSTVSAQAPTHSAPAQSSTQDQLAKQIEDLRAQVARLQAALDQQRQSTPSPAAPVPTQPQGGMRMDDMGKMEMGKMPQSGMPMGQSNMPQGSMGMGEMGRQKGCCMGMDMHRGEMGMPPDGMKMPAGMMMDDMGRMGSTQTGSGMSSGAMTPPTSAGTTPTSGGMNMAGRAATPAPNMARSMSSLPGVPGASHLYHIGSTGFFLDQPQLSLTPQQQSALNAIKERALLERGNTERRIEQGEQELWSLTAADQPDATKIQAKAREIEQARTNQRLSFIQAVGEATKVLTPEQHNRLLGSSGMPAK